MFVYRISMVAAPWDEDYSTVRHKLHVLMWAMHTFFKTLQALSEMGHMWPPCHSLDTPDLGHSCPNLGPRGVDLIGVLEDVSPLLQKNWRSILEERRNVFKNLNQVRLPPSFRPPLLLNPQSICFLMIKVMTTKNIPVMIEFFISALALVFLDTITIQFKTC